MMLKRQYQGVLFLRRWDFSFEEGENVRDCVNISFIIVSIVTRLKHSIRKRPSTTAKDSVPDLYRLARGRVLCD